MDGGFKIFCGPNIGKNEPQPERSLPLFDTPLPQDEARLREPLTPSSEDGEVLVVVDQPNTIGALEVAAARGCIPMFFVKAAGALFL
jgi:hypothetical protein